MATSPFAGSYPALPESFAHHITRPAPSRVRTASQIVRRRPTREQGRALEILGHAIEYLIDSQLYRGTEADAAGIVEAQQILMRLNRDVFAGCAEIVPLARRVRARLARVFV